MGQVVTPCIHLLCGWVGRISIVRLCCSRAKWVRKERNAALSKRKADGLETEPTRKAPRIDAVADSDDLDALLEQLRRSVQRIKNVSPVECTAAQLAMAAGTLNEAFKWCDRVEEQHEALRNPSPVETPIPFDDLVQVLSHLGASDLASVAQVSRHFARAVPEAVRLALNELASEGCEEEGYFELRSDDTYCPSLLDRVEKDLERTPGLIKRIKPNMKKNVLDEVEQELDDVHAEVLYLCRADLWAALAKLPLEDESQFKRNTLLHLLYRARIPPEELSEYADVVVEQIRSPTFLRIYTLSLFERMLPAVHVEHLDLILDILNAQKCPQSTTFDAHDVEIALRVASEIPIPTLAPHLAVIKALTTAKDCDMCRSAKKLCWQIEQHVPK